jgi:hypothetical protein
MCAGNLPQMFYSLSGDAQRALISGARDLTPVRGFTHGFYKYPARFSPSFVRAVIQAFTRPGDTVLDNHVGGGTTLVEAAVAGRHCIGVDISSLAEFVTRVKTTTFSARELKRLVDWAEQVPADINLRKIAVQFPSYAELGYYKHLSHSTRWRLRKAIELGLGSALALKSEVLVNFGRCAVLRTAQWALDGRRHLPPLAEFRVSLRNTAIEMVAGARDFSAAMAHHAEQPDICILNRTAIGLEMEDLVLGRPAPRLVITSPPYPGVHILYHRWQVDGRKEASVPFMIAGKLDGAGSSFYTMGDRKFPELRTYFDAIRGSMASVAALADQHTVVVQMLAFSNPSWQLPRYLRTMDEAGLAEQLLPALQGEGDGRLWRRVPGRRWYSDQRGATPGSQEVVLFHRLKRPAIRSPLPIRRFDHLPTGSPAQAR